MCKQHEKKDPNSGVKSLPLLRRELEHLEDYFVYKEEIDSNENCIVLTCSLSKSNNVVMASHCFNIWPTKLHFGWPNLLYIFNGTAINNRLLKMADQFLALISTNKKVVIILIFIALNYFTEDDYVPADIPSLIVRIPDNYPTVPPEYIMNGYRNNSLLLNIEKQVGKQLISMNLYSVTQLLHVWVSDGTSMLYNVITCSRSSRNPVYAMQ